MCGVAGIVGAPLGARADGLAAMLRALEHRGPDDEGVWREGEASLGHRRLSIVDLSPTGRQPMVSADGRRVIVLNGEVYNHRALRAELGRPTAGEWRGSSDVEVLLEAIGQWGLEAALARAFGMFAFALWDRREAALHLVRDRFGEKPLYYAQSPAGLAFASELTGLRRGVDPGDLDPAAVAAYFRLGYVPAPLTIFAGARKLPPGGWLTWRRGEAGEPRPWWTLDAITSAGAAEPLASDDEAIEELDGKLRAVIGEQMSADVPVGVFLSGGLDSSLTAAVMQSLSAKPIRSFTMGFADPAYDEAPDAAAVARHLGTDHAQHIVGEADALRVIPTVGQAWDEPFADPSQIPTLLMCGLARREVKVCLSGDGGDEMFAGYVRYDGVPRLWRALAPWPRRLRRAAAWALADAPLALLDRGLAGLGPIARRYTGRGRLGDDLRRAAPWIGAADADDLYRRTMSVWRPAAAARLVPRARCGGSRVAGAGCGGADAVARHPRLPAGRHPGEGRPRRHAPRSRDPRAAAG